MARADGSTGSWVGVTRDVFGMGQIERVSGGAQCYKGIRNDQKEICLREMLFLQSRNRARQPTPRNAERWRFMSGEYSVSRS